MRHGGINLPKVLKQPSQIVQPDCHLGVIRTEHGLVDPQSPFLRCLALHPNAPETVGAFLTNQEESRSHQRPPSAFQHDPLLPFHGARVAGQLAKWRDHLPQKRENDKKELESVTSQFGGAWIYNCEESMLRQASRLSIKMTGNPAFCAGRSHQQSPKPRDCFPRFSTGSQ